MGWKKLTEMPRKDVVSPFLLQQSIPMVNRQPSAMSARTCSRTLVISLSKFDACLADPESQVKIICSKCVFALM